MKADGSSEHIPLFDFTRYGLDDHDHRYPFLACEIMACEIPQIVDAVVLENKGMLESFWTFLNRPAPPRRRAADETKEQDDNDEETCLDSLQAQYFCKTISVFLTKRTGEVSIKMKDLFGIFSLLTYDTSHFRCLISSNPSQNTWNRFSVICKLQLLWISC